MAKTYHFSSGKRLVNRVMGLFIRLGLAPHGMHLLTVTGRKSGRVYSTPVTLVEQGRDRWLVAPYGEVGWVRNARVTGQVKLTRGRHTETVSLSPVAAAESASVLRQYLLLEPITQPYFDARPNSPLAAFEAEVARHPVFYLQSVPVVGHER